MARIRVVYHLVSSEAELTIPLAPGYGSTPDVAHDLLWLGLTAEWPIVVDANGETHRLPPGSVMALATWAESLP